MAEFYAPRGGDLSKSLDNLKRRLNEGAAPPFASLKAPLPPALPPLLRRDPMAPEPRASSSRRLFLFGGVAAALHFGLSKKDNPAGASVNQLAVRVTGLVGSDGPATPEAIEQMAMAGSYSTDFSETDALTHWWQAMKDGLVLEPFEKQMSAVPHGPSLATPTQMMRDGFARFQFVQDHRPAGFILRGQDHRDYYRLLYTATTNRGRPEMVLSARVRRSGKEREIARENVSDLRLATMTRAHISVQMEGANFAARLHWVEPSRIPGWTIPKEKVIATWKDDTFRTGAMGVWGLEDASVPGEFRLLTVEAEV